jgi:hypothetical protein
MTSTPHTDCTHEATSSARAKCRRDRADGIITLWALVDYSDAEFATYLTKDEALDAASRSGLIRPSVREVRRPARPSDIR